MPLPDHNEYIWLLDEILEDLAQYPPGSRQEMLDRIRTDALMALSERIERLAGILAGLGDPPAPKEDTDGAL